MQTNFHLQRTWTLLLLFAILLTAMNDGSSGAPLKKQVAVHKACGGAHSPEEGVAPTEGAVLENSAPEKNAVREQSPEPEQSPGPELQNCLEIEKFIEQQFMRHVMFLRRGVSERVVGVYYRSMLNHLTSVLAQNYDGHMQFNKVCLTVADRNLLSDRVGNQTIEMFLKNAIDEEPNLFYLPPEQYSDEKIKNYRTRNQRRIQKFWARAQLLMQERIADVDMDTMYKLPKTLRLFYDPNKESVLADYSRMVSHEDNVVSATSLLESVLAIVIRLELLNVSRVASLQILLHCTAVIFNAIRATRFESSQLLVSDLYLGLYDEVVRNLTTEADRTRIPEVPRYIIQNFVMNKVKWLLKYRGWGRLSTLCLRDKFRVEQVYVEDLVFDPKMRKRIESQLQVSKDSNDSSSAEALAPSEDSTYINLYNHVVREDTTCGKQYWYYKMGSTAKSRCCSNICKALTSTTIDNVSVDQCCVGCNQSRCPPDGANLSVKTAISVTTYDFGLSGIKHVRIWI